VVDSGWREVAASALTFIQRFASSSAPAARHSPKPTVVLVHGAFADASGWSDVIEGLERQGYPVIAPANPLRGVKADAEYMRACLATIQGPIVLVGHSYGGVVITNAATGNPNVKALVYVAAFAPDEGDTVESLGNSEPAAGSAPRRSTCGPIRRPQARRRWRATSSSTCSATSSPRTSRARRHERWRSPSDPARS
jgi:pimeloyl-ACP methyl ester carboxylesterase